MTTSWMLWSLLFGSAGFGFLVYGTRQKVIVPTVCGVSLMLYPFFVTNVYLMVAIGLVLVLIPRYVKL